LILITVRGQIIGLSIFLDITMLTITDIMLILITVSVTNSRS
jgi:hypothetical protein